MYYLAWGIKAGMPQGLKPKRQAGCLDRSRDGDQVCYRMKTPRIQHDKPHKSKGFAFAGDL